MNELNRRDFMKTGAIATIGMGVVSKSAFANSEAVKTVKVGVIGVGGRGTGHVTNLLTIEGVEVAAVCDLFIEKAENAASICEKAGRKKPKIYCKDLTTYKEMLAKEKLDAVNIATYWESHADIGLAAMENGTYPGIEVPAALTVENTWKLIETSQRTGIPCMMLENWSFRQDNLAALNMKRLGMFGEIVHCHCAHSHDCIDHWFFDSKTGEQKWPAKYLLNYNRDQYPTHAVGPIISWMDINRGDRFTEIYSTASASKGINSYFKRKFGNDHPNANLKYKQGDIVTSVLKTKMGKTLVINYDMQLPRPYSNRWLLEGTKGVYDEEKASIYLIDQSPEYHIWEPWKPYEQKYNHKWWQGDYSNQSHGGTDYVMLCQFIDAVREKGPTPIDVYDSAVMTAIVELSGISIEKNAPVPFPDFTKGKWETNKPYFAMDKSI